MAITAQQTAIASLYTALFNRAPDADGFAFWTQALANGASLLTLIEGFLGTPESRAIYRASQTSEQFITAFYTTVFGRAPDASGLAFWAGALDANGGAGSAAAKSAAVAQIIALVSTPLASKPADISDAQYAQTVADRSLFANKVAVGVYYAVEVKGTDIDLGKRALAVVTDNPASVDAGKAIAAGSGDGGTPPVTPPPVGEIFNGTLGTDTFTGTAGDDTFNFVVDANDANSTLGRDDTIVGGAGTDTLNVTTVGAVDVLNGATISGIEKIAIRTDAGWVASLTVPTGVSTVAVSGGGGVNLSSLPAGATFAIVGATGNPVYLTHYVSTATAANIAVSGGSRVGPLTVTSSTLTSAKITGSDGVNVLGNISFGSNVKAITLDAQSALKTGVITAGGDAALTVTGAGVAEMLLDGAIATVNAGANTGGLTTTVSSDTQTIVGSAGVNTISTGIALTTGSVAAGAGTGDTLIVTNSAGLNSTALGAKYIGFEVLQVVSGVTMDMDNISGITGVRIASGGGAPTTANNLSAAQASAITILQTGTTSSDFITVGVKGASNAGQVDTVKATVATADSNEIDLRYISLTGVERLELIGNGTDAASTGTVKFSTSYSTALESIIVRNLGGASVTVSQSHSVANLSIDASGSAGSVTLDASSYGASTGAVLKGGSGTNTLNGSRFGDTIIGGAGDDVLIADGKLNAVPVAEVQNVRFSGTATTTGTYMLGGVTVNVGAGQTAESVAAEFLAGGSVHDAFLQANKAASITYASGAFTVTWLTTSGNVRNIPAELTGGSGLAADAAGSQQVGGVESFGIPNLSAAIGSDTLTGGAGKDNFMFARNSSNVDALDTITDLELGTDSAAGKADTLTFRNVGGVASVVTLSAAEQLTVSSAATLAGAAVAALAVASTDGATAIFMYQDETYVIHNGDGNGTFDNAEDFLVKVTGVTGVLDLSDIALITN